MNLLKRRIARQNASTVVACELNDTLSLWETSCRYTLGNNKDNKELPNTLEVVVYSVDSFEPIYYRSFGGNENDQRTLRTIVSDLEALGCRTWLLSLTVDTKVMRTWQKWPESTCPSLSAERQDRSLFQIF